MMDFWTIHALLCLILFLWVGINLAIGILSMTYLADISPHAKPGSPMVSIIIPALNEEDSIEKSLRSVLNLDYPNYEIIVVNDRSTDRTGVILDRLGEEHPQLKVIHLEELPAGWLGKNHALFLGAGKARGDFLLFTDADVNFEKSSLNRAMNHLLTRKLDHLALTFNIVPHGGIYNSMIIESGILMFVALQPWKARNPRAKQYVGVGAFNLVSRKAYKACGTHEAIALLVIDDVGLGKLIKDKGFRQEIVLGLHFLTVDWYASVSEMINGLLKNVFAFLKFDFFRVLSHTLLVLVFGIWPFFGIFMVGSPANWIYLLAVCVRFAPSFALSRVLKIPLRDIIWFPFNQFVFLFILWKSTWSVLRNKGIIWRGTHYSLENLRTL